VGERIATPAEVLNAISQASSNRAAVGFGPWCSPEMAHQLALYRKKKAAPGRSVSIGPERRPEPPVPPPVPVVETTTAEPPAGLVRLPEPKQVSGVSVQLDVSVERRRSFWWRLAVSLVARRLR
jgi:hypothetical protein